MTLLPLLLLACDRARTMSRPPSDSGSEPTSPIDSEAESQRGQRLARTAWGTAARPLDSRPLDSASPAETFRSWIRAAARRSTARWLSKTWAASWTGKRPQSSASAGRGGCHAPFGWRPTPRCPTSPAERVRYLTQDRGLPVEATALVPGSDSEELTALPTLLSCTPAWASPMPARPAHWESRERPSTSCSRPREWPW